MGKIVRAASFTFFIVVVLGLLYIVAVMPVQPKTLKYDKWSGLGMVTHSETETERFDDRVDRLLAYGFIELRIDIPNYMDTTLMAQSKAAVIRAIAKGVKVIWGVSSNSFEDPAAVITAANWPTFRQAILDAATWAQANGVYEFQVGNEEEYHVDGTTITVAQIITNLKSVAVDAQAIFTNGNISYSCSYRHLSNWIAVGKGDLDLLAFNVYMGWGSEYNDDWKTAITDSVNTFGANGTYLSEFGPSSTSLADYSADEAVQAAAVTEMINYIKASRMTRAFYFKYEGDEFGAMNWDGTYKSLWTQAILNNTESATTVPTTTKSLKIFK